MLEANIFEAKAHLSALVERVLRGETIILCKRNKPVAELRPVAKRRNKTRPLGLGKGTVTLKESFFDPLPEELLDAFEGKS